MDEANAAASRTLFQAKNAGRGLGEIDLHGQFVHEAEQLAEERIVAARQAGLDSVVIIYGKGIHSADHVQKLKP
eukprot:jgi/Hompol1/5622/HPOL_000860-RA